MTSEWPVSTVGEQFDVQLGKMLDSANNVGELKPYIGNRAVQWQRIDVSNLGAVRLTPNDMRRYRLKKGDLLVCEGGEVGRGAIWQDQSPECYFQKALHRLRPRRSFDVRLMLTLLEYWSSIGAFNDYITQTSIAHLPREKFIQMPLPLPPAQEQAALGEILQDTEDLLAALERLIAKKQAIQHGVQQQLLTGRTRLTGFGKPWADVRLGDHATYVKTVALSRAQLDSASSLRYLHYGDIHARTTSRLAAATEPMPRAPRLLIRSAGLLQIGDVVFADASEDSDGVGKSVEITSVPTGGVIPGLHTIAARFDKVVLADGFKAYLQFIPQFRESLLRLVAGTKVLATTRRYISGISLALPDLDEQRAISRALIDCEAEGNHSGSGAVMLRRVGA